MFKPAKGEGGVGGGRAATLRLFSVPPLIAAIEGESLQQLGRDLAVYQGGRWHAAGGMRLCDLADED